MYLYICMCLFHVFLRSEDDDRKRVWDWEIVCLEKSWINSNGIENKGFIVNLLSNDKWASWYM